MCATMTPGDTDAMSLSDSNTPVEISSYFCSPQIYDLKYILLANVQAPHSLHLSDYIYFVIIFPSLSLPLHVMILRTICSWHSPRNKILL